MISRCLPSYFRVCNLKMSSTPNVTLLPNNVRGMKELDRDKFVRSIKVAVLNSSSIKVSQIVKVCKPYLLKLEHFKPLQFVNDDDKSTSPYRLIFLHPDKIRCWTDFTENDRKILNEYDVTEANLCQKEIRLTYKHFTYEEIFKVVLPDLERISGFSRIGHIVHLNLREHLIPYKKLIGAVLLDKLHKCRTVVNKISRIDCEYRIFKMEVIAGYDDFMVTVKEHNCYFHFDFAKVYWNPRLSEEHGRVLDCIEANDVLFDVFCGVGPFAIPAAKKKCRVFANDLNPDSFQWLNYNKINNKLKNADFKTFNMEGKDFINTVFKQFIEDCCEGNEVLPTDAKIHVTMNLPGLAVEFLKYFNGLIDIELIDKFNLDIIVYLYCFSCSDKSIETAKQMVIDHSQRDIESDILDVSFVRKVSPTKDMMKVTFRLTKETLFGFNKYTDIECNMKDTDLDEPVTKKRCVETPMIV